MATDLLKPSAAGGLGAADIVLQRQEPAGEPPDIFSDPPDPPPPTQIPLAAQAFGVDEKLVGTEASSGVAIRATDIMVIAAPFPGGWQPSKDSLSVSGRPAAVVSVERIPAAGKVSAYQFIVRAG